MKTHNLLTGETGASAEEQEVRTYLLKVISMEASREPVKITSFKAVVRDF